MAVARQRDADLTHFHFGTGRELFAAFRANALGAEQGAVTFIAAEPQGDPTASHAAPIHDRFAFVDEDTRS